MAKDTEVFMPQSAILRQQGASAVEADICDTMVWVRQSVELLDAQMGAREVTRIESPSPSR